MMMTHSFIKLVTRVERFKAQHCKEEKERRKVAGFTFQAQQDKHLANFPETNAAESWWYQGIHCRMHKYLFFLYLPYLVSFFFLILDLRIIKKTI